MLLQKKQNSWGCFVTAFATVLNKPVQELYDYFGHDGGEILDAQPDPKCRRGFHIQELIDYALQCGFAVTCIDALPAFLRPGGLTVDMVPLSQAQVRFDKHLGNSEGVLIGNIGDDIFHCHAIVNSFGKLYNPDTGGLYNPNNFTVQCYYRIDQL